MVIQSAPATQTLVETGAPPWAQRLALRLPQVFQPIRPYQPTRLWQVVKADLPLASAWPWTVVVVTDQACLAVSDGATWQKIAFGGPV